MLDYYKNNKLRLVVTKYKGNVSYMLIGTDKTDSVNTINMYINKKQLDSLLKVSYFVSKESVFSCKMYHYRYGTQNAENKLKELFSFIN